MKNNTEITKDVANKTLLIIREFNSPIDKVWHSWTDSTALDKWWAPKPYKADTKTFDLKPGGIWLYSMTGPQGDVSWCRQDYGAIKPKSELTWTARFCDEKGVIDNSFPTMHWVVKFMASNTGTRIETKLSFDNEADMQKIIQMGFQEGFTMGLNNLDELLAQ